jgi:NADH-quinone oxidoreductase subunit L
VYELDKLDTVLPFGILLLPLFGFVVLALFGGWIKRDGEENGAGWLACATVLTSFGLAVWTTVRLYALTASEAGLRFSQPVLAWPPLSERAVPINWMEAGGFSIPFSLLVDPLSCVMMLVVTGVGSLIHIYSLGYMAHDEERVRYFSYLNLFTFFMLLLVLGGSLPLLFVGWEGVGLCSYLLIGFWYRKQSASAAGLKAFVVNRIGDVGLILGMAFMFYAFGSLDLVDIADNAGALAPEALWEFGPATIACLLLFVGATGKSAQIPLHVWLPDAMEGPTPVSALIHAATMVTAGVYLVARLGPLYAVSETAMMTVAVIGGATALMAATIALVQTDIKKVLAYSTVSQLGYMFLACGVGAFGVGIFHLYTHAFFKALLFLGSGSVIHAMSGEQDMRKMGGLRKTIPWTFWTFVVGVLAIAGIYPFSGFFSKDEILLAALHHPVLFGIGLFTALLTSFYMARLLFLTFFGSFRGGEEAEHHVHESPSSMVMPLVLLAVGSAVGGFVSIPHVVEPVFREAQAHLDHAAWLPVVATLSAVAGILLAWYLYLSMPELRAGVASALRPALRVFAAKYYWDEVYNGFVRRVVIDGSRAVLWERVDAMAIDGAVNRAGTITGALAEMIRPLQTGLVRHYALLILAGAVALLGWVLWS